MFATFQGKQTTLIFSTETFPKTDLEFELQKTNVGIRISILEISCVPFFRQMDNVEFFGRNLNKNRFTI